MWKVLLFLSPVFFAAGVNGQSEVCSELDISYDDKPIGFGNTVRFDCVLQGSSFQWWRSNSQCGDFVPYDACAGTPCDVLVNDSIQRYFYYCCTGEGVSAISRQVAKDCFHVQICTQITSTGPVVAFFGSALNISVSMYAEPPPAPIEPEVQLEYANKSITLPAERTQGELVSLGQDVTLLVWAYTVQVMDIEMNASQGSLVFAASYARIHEDCLSNQGASHITYHIPVVRSNRQQSTPATTQTEPVQSLSVVDCTSQTVAAVVTSLLLFGFLTISLVVNCICGIYICKPRNRSSETTGIRTRPGNLGYSSVPNTGSATPTPVGPYHNTLTTIHEEVEPRSVATVERGASHTPSTPLPQLPFEGTPTSYTHVHNVNNKPESHVYDTTSKQPRSDSSVVIVNGNETAPNPTRNGNETASQPTQNGNGTATQPLQNGNETIPQPARNGNETTPGPLFLDNEQARVTHYNPYTLPATPTLDENKDSRAKAV